MWKEVHLLKHRHANTKFMELLFIGNRTRRCHRPNTYGVVRWRDELFILFITSLYRLHMECVCARVHVHFHLEVISCVFPVAEHRSVWCGSSKLSPTSRETIRPYSHKPSLSSPLSGIITEPSNSHIYNLRTGQF